MKMNEIPQEYQEFSEIPEDFQGFKFLRFLKMVTYAQRLNPEKMWKAMPGKLVGALHNTAT